MGLSGGPAGLRAPGPELLQALLDRPLAAAEEEEVPGDPDPDRHVGDAQVRQAGFHCSGFFSPEPARTAVFGEKSVRRPSSAASSASARASWAESTRTRRATRTANRPVKTTSIHSIVTSIEVGSRGAAPGLTTATGCSVRHQSTEKCTRGTSTN